MFGVCEYSIIDITYVDNTHKYVIWLVMCFEGFSVHRTTMKLGDKAEQRARVIDVVILGAFCEATDRRN